MLPWDCHIAFGKNSHGLKTLQQNDETIDQRLGDLFHPESILGYKQLGSQHPFKTREAARFRVIKAGSE